MCSFNASREKKLCVFRLISARKLILLKISSVERVEYLHTCEIKIENNRKKQKSHWKKKHNAKYQ